MHWQNTFLEITPQFALFKCLELPFQTNHDWPNCQQLNTVAATNEFKGYEFVPQEKLEGNYELFIQQNQQIPTRSSNWHDFFHYLIWLLFPNTKKTNQPTTMPRTIKTKTTTATHPKRKCINFIR